MFEFFKIFVILFVMLLIHWRERKRITLNTSFFYKRSPRMRRASWMSFGIIVTRLAWIAHKLVSSNRPTRYASEASWKTRSAVDWNLIFFFKSWAISRTRRWKGDFWMRRSLFSNDRFHKERLFQDKNDVVSLHLLLLDQISVLHMLPKFYVVLSLLWTFK